MVQKRLLMSWMVLPLLMVFLLSSSYANKDPHDFTNTKSKKCSKCHEDIYEQWKGSMHANSTALKDPIHGTFYELVVGDPRKEGVKQGGKKYPVCLQCHAPTAAKAGKTKLDAKAVYNEGVNCVSCHTLTKFKGTTSADGKPQLGMKAYDYSKTQLQGTKEVTQKHVKKFGSPVASNAGFMKTSGMCLGCHDQRSNSNNVSLCQTGGEVMAAGGSSTCQSCHMPVVDGKANHAMMGGHSPAVVAKGMVMTMSAKASADKIKATVTLQNLLPHNFPTGAPFRNVFIKVIAYGKDGGALWSNTKSHPMEDDKQSVLMFMLGDKNHQPASPPTATEIMFDSRLKPNEKRDIIYTIKAKGVVKVKAEAFYDLLLPPLKKKFDKQLPANVKKSEKIAEAEVVF